MLLLRAGSVRAPPEQAVLVVWDRAAAPSALVFAALICASFQHWTATGSVILRAAEGS